MVLHVKAKPVGCELHPEPCGVVTVDLMNFCDGVEDPQPVRPEPRGVPLGILGNPDNLRLLDIAVDVGIGDDLCQDELRLVPDAGLHQLKSWKT